MTTEELDSRRARRAAARAARLEPKVRHDYRARRRSRRIRQAAFGLIVASVLAVGGYLAFGDLAGQRGAATTIEAIPVRLSMAGFTPSEIEVPAGETVSLELWTTDAAPHLENGVHTMISDELDIHEELPAAGPSGESRKVVTITTPTEPGTYDIYCDTCCGGKASPGMHGTLTVIA
jgi:heme/copper-type cytochrome/quinol oxidase subunit 2